MRILGSITLSLRAVADSPGHGSTAESATGVGVLVKINGERGAAIDSRV